MKNIQMKLVNVLYFMYEMGIVGYFSFPEEFSIEKFDTEECEK